jgi:DNA helicase-2/ATP-dependent DNA helicase PcrA
MNELIKRKNELKLFKKKYTKKILQIDTELNDLEKKMSRVGQDDIVKSLNLSHTQKLVVNATENNILVLSVAGSGKTHTVISRYIVLILKHNVNPNSVILITFTKKAGNEMLERLHNIIPDKLPYHTGSLHSLVYKVLQKYLNINSTILNEKEIEELLKIVTKNELKNSNLDETVKKEIESSIYYIINQATINYPINFKTILKKINLLKYNSIINQIYKEFNKRKKLENIMDFNDLLIMFCNFLKTSKSDKFKNQIKYVFFDEYQDINPIQNYILGVFKNNSKIMVVGDDAQAIYSFRGSTIGCILDFPKVFTPSIQYLLEDNYRSSPSIINFCNNIISKNTNQYKKIVKPIQTEIGFKPIINGFNSYDEQYRWIINDIIEKLNNGTPFSDIVVLSRKRDSINKIELLLTLAKIPSIKLFGLATLEQEYIKDILAFATIIINPKSSSHWKRILRFFHDQHKVNDIVEKSKNIFNTIKDLSFANAEIDNFINIYNSINEIYVKGLEKLKIIISYLEKLWIHKGISYNKKDINMLVSIIKNATLDQFLNDLQIDQDCDIENTDGITLSTIHGSKGLEWEHVYVIDVNGNDLPNVYSKSNYFIEELNNIEEERRLFYVACSRAKKILIITYHTDSRINVSPFISEIDKKLYITQTSVEQSSDIIPKIGKLYNLDIKEKEIHNEITTKFPKNFLIYLIYKMIQNNFTNKIAKFDMSCDLKCVSEYLNPTTHWSKILDTILKISQTQNTNKSESNSRTEFNNVSLEYMNIYKDIESGIIKLVNLYSPENIYINRNFNSEIKCTINLLFDNIIIDIKMISGEICTLTNLLRVLSYGLMFEKNKLHINKIIFYNIMNGSIKILDTTKFEF